MTRGRRDITPGASPHIRLVDCNSALCCLLRSGSSVLCHFSTFLEANVAFHVFFFFFFRCVAAPSLSCHVLYIPTVCDRRHWKSIRLTRSHQQLHQFLSLLQVQLDKNTSSSFGWFLQQFVALYVHAVSLSSPRLPFVELLLSWQRDYLMMTTPCLLYSTSAGPFECWAASHAGTNPAGSCSFPLHR